METKTTALEALRKFAHQRPGLDIRNYFQDMRDVNGIAAYRQEVRDISAQLKRFTKIYREALAYGVTDADLNLEDKSDRLTWTGTEWDYTTGQYFPTEYRNAAANKLERAVKAAKERTFKPMPDREYSIAEMREIATRSGSHFFTNKRPGERYTKINGNKVSVLMGEGQFRRNVLYQFNPADGSFDWLSDDVAQKNAVLA
jgi:collagenase-like PrtC family protease